MRKHDCIITAFAVVGVSTAVASFSGAPMAASAAQTCNDFYDWVHKQYNEQTKEYDYSDYHSADGDGATKEWLVSEPITDREGNPHSEKLADHILGGPADLEHQECGSGGS